MTAANTPPELPEQIAQDIAAISGIEAVPGMLEVICAMTGMGYAAVARVTETSWTVCASRDGIGMGLDSGSQLPIETTLCQEARLRREAIAFDHASQDPVYRNHITPRLYGIESYISVPIIRRDGSYFGNLCAVDRHPADASSPKVRAMFKLFAELLAHQLEGQEQRRADAVDLMNARQVSELREQFIAVLGHDLRNPLSAVAAASELLMKRATDAEVATIGRRLRATARRMGALIDDVTDFARGRMGGGMGADLRPVLGLAESLLAVVHEARLAEPDRDLVCEIETMARTQCDPARLQQLLSNLLGNALTHGARDKPVVVRAAVRNEVLELSVGNWGLPIAPENLAKVFEPYWRPAGSRAGGLGLGLYICAQIAKAHGGAMRATSSEHAGTWFTAVIPVHGPV